MKEKAIKNDLDSAVEGMQLEDQIAVLIEKARLIKLRILKRKLEDYCRSGGSQSDVEVEQLVRFSIDNFC